MDEFNLDQATQDINKEEFQLERVSLQAFVAATDPGCKKELISVAAPEGCGPSIFDTADKVVAAPSAYRFLYKKPWLHDIHQNPSPVTDSLYSTLYHRY
ncbi:hypothetical protein TNCV_2558641 [Trichonephila clavipes]|nr:hypothetical protein TNCV_2558641 [Trichonephila clavipes]